MLATGYIVKYRAYTVPVYIYISGWYTVCCCLQYSLCCKHRCHLGAQCNQTTGGSSKPLNELPDKIHLEQQRVLDRTKNELI